MKAIVVGGGVAGAAGAIALARIGAEVTVYEAYEDPAGTVGSFVSLATNGLRALDALGCLTAVQEAGFAVARQRMWSGGGKLLGDVDRGRLPGDGLHSVTLMRADLVAALRKEAERAGARIVTGQRQDPAMIAAGWFDVPDRPDVIVGADGIWSAARRALDPAAPEPAYAGLYSVSGVSDGLGNELGMEPGTFNMIFGRRGAFIHLTAPDGTVWWSAQIAAPEPPDLAAVGLGDVAEQFRTERRATTVLNSARGIHSATLLHVLAPVPRHRDGRTVLIGDAAHPAGAGQGASMAIEDAVVLARWLRQADTVEAALAGYDQDRRARTGKLARSAAANRDAKTAGPIAGRMRDLMMPFFFNRFYGKATSWLYTYDPGSLTEPGRLVG